MKRSEMVKFLERSIWMRLHEPNVELDERYSRMLQDLEDAGMAPPPVPPYDHHYWEDDDDQT